MIENNTLEKKVERINLYEDEIITDAKEYLDGAINRWSKILQRVTRSVHTKIESIKEFTNEDTTISLKDGLYTINTTENNSITDIYGNNILLNDKTITLNSEEKQYAEIIKEMLTELPYKSLADFFTETPTTKITGNTTPFIHPKEYHPGLEVYIFAKGNVYTDEETKTELGYLIFPGTKKEIKNVENDGTLRIYNNILTKITKKEAFIIKPNFKNKLKPLTNVIIYPRGCRNPKKYYSPLQTTEHVIAGEEGQVIYGYKNKYGIKIHSKELNFEIRELELKNNNTGNTSYQCIGSLIKINKLLNTYIADMKQNAIKTDTVFKKQQ